ncbi:GSCFA domain-containing protein [Hymenobacter koreensis]|uniref:GSCFA domain-containing protein n=1 Tax=Hymenobacter koreensis TaxID=1084523 RepID=A0ABP8IVC0_9BACT
MFRTELAIKPDPQPLSVGARVFTIGSCFSDVIGARLAAHKVASQVNPFGTVFNPLSAAKLLRAAAGEEVDWQQHVVEARGRWQSYDLHANFGADSPAELVKRIEETVASAADFLRTADVVVWTLGTAFSYHLRDTGELVNNLHKLPAARFEKELLSAEDIVTAVAETHALLRRLNPKIRLVLTVSPVRHLRDTLPLNSVSKSVLRIACHYLAELLPGTTYFPAYELVLDDLRDYRFYGADMLHPSEVAEDYVWEKFMGAYFDEAFRDFVFEWDAIQRSLGHRPLHEGAPEHRHFLEQTEARLQRLSNVVNVRQELRELHKRIVALPPPKPVVQPEDEDDEERIDIGEGSAPVSESAKRPAASEADEPLAQEVFDWATALAEEQTVAPSVSVPEAAAEAQEAEIDEENDFFEFVAGSSLDEPQQVTAAENADEEAPKRRKRKRGGRKHKRGNRGEGQPAETVESETVDAIPVDALAVEITPSETNGAASEHEPEPIEMVSEAKAPEVAAVRTSKSRRGRRKKPAPSAETVAETPAAPVAETASIVSESISSTPEANIEIETSVAKPKKASTRKPARKPAPARPRPNRQATAGLEPAPPVAPPAPAPEVPPAAEAAPEQAAAPRRRAAPRRKPAVAAAVAAAASELAPPVPPAPASTSETAPAAPKRRARPPRRKPDAPDAS